MDITPETAKLLVDALLFSLGYILMDYIRYKVAEYKQKRKERLEADYCGWKKFSPPYFPDSAMWVDWNKVAEESKKTRIMVPFTPITLEREKAHCSSDCECRKEKEIKAL